MTAVEEPQAEVVARDFDQERAERAAADRRFRIGGETFVRKASVRPEVLVKYETMTITANGTDTLKMIDECVIDLIEPDDDAAGRWTAIREREEDPISLLDIQELAQWLIEGLTNRPTERPSRSTRGPGRTRTTSTGGSS